MNTHSKLREIGFTRTTFHKPNEFLDGANMLPDNIERRWGLRKDNSHGWIETPKVHPKSNSFWKLNFSERYTIWISVVSNNTIHYKDTKVFLLSIRLGSLDFNRTMHLSNNNTRRFN